MTERKGAWMQTAGGRAYWPLDPRPDEVFIDDIAHALGMLCRYGGHCLDFYSVAEHSVHVSHLVPPAHALVALMHDSTEAYCIDVPRPLKKSLSNYAEIERLNWLAICDAFALNPELPECVHEADIAICYAERAALLLPSPRDDWGMGMKSTMDVSRVRIFGHLPGRASKIFLNRFHELTNVREAV